MSAHLVQVNIRLPADKADQLKALADQAGLKVAALVERMIDCYKPCSNLLQTNESTDDLTSRIEALEFKASGDDVAELFQLVGDLATRLTALESRLPAPAQLQTTLQLDNPAELAPIAAVIAELKQTGFKPVEIADELNSRGYRTNRGTLYMPAYIRKMMGG